MQAASSGASTIVGVRAFVLRAPIEIPVVTSFGTMRDRPALLVRIVDSEGRTGWGESWCNFPSVGAEHRARLIDHVLAPALIGQSAEAPEQLFDSLTRRFEVLALQSGEPGPFAQAIAGIDIALWDLAAQRAGMPLWRLLDGSEQPDFARVPVYASGIHPDGAAATVLRQRTAGYAAFKLKVGFSQERDLTTVRELMELLRPHERLCIDANQGWSLEQALSMVSELAGLPLEWLEEPLRVDRPWSEWRRLAAATAIPLAGGENFASGATFDEALSQGALAVYQPDLAKWGGLTGCRRVAYAARAAGQRYCPHFLGAGVGLLASAHLLAAVGGDGWLEVDSNPNPLRDRLCPPLATLQDGAITLPESPGLGVAPELEQFESILAQH